MDRVGPFKLGLAGSEHATAPTPIVSARIVLIFIVSGNEGARNVNQPRRALQCLTNMRRRIVGLLALMVCSKGLRAQAVRGSVQDAATHKPIANAVVQVGSDSAARRVISDASGGFALHLPGPGLYMVVATRIGYLKHDADTVRVGAGETVTLRIELDQTAVPLHPVIVTDRFVRMSNGFEQRRALGFGRFLDSDDIEKRHASKTTYLFRGLPGAHLTPLPRGAGLILQLRKGAGFCQPFMLIDGLPVGESRQSLDLLIDSNMIEAIELYQSVSTAPVQYRSGDCGVVLFWMKHGPAEAATAKPQHWKLALGIAAAVGLLAVLVVGHR